VLYHYGIVILVGGGVLDLDNKYEIIFNTINQGVVFRDLDGHITSLNL
jgi:PAS domain-containing protein